MPSPLLAQRRVLAATGLSYVLVILDTSIVNVALERIAATLHTGISGLQWVVSAYTLSFASLLLSGGALGDRFGARRLYLAGLVVFTLASLLCGVSGDWMTLVAARVLQGVGAALLVPGSLALINQAFANDPAGRATAIGVWAGCGGIAMAAGPLVGGVLIELFGWRSIFLANLPLGLIAIGLSARLAASERSPRALDVRGQLSAILALATLIGVLIEGPVRGWSSTPILLAGLLSVAAWGTFIRIEIRHAQPMLPLKLFANPVFSACVAVSLISALMLYGLVFLLSLYFQRVLGYSPLWTGLAFLPLTALVSLGSLVAGRLVRVWGSERLIGVALLLYLAGFGPLLLYGPTTSYLWIALPMPVIGLAAGLITPAATSALMGTVDKHRAGIAAGTLNAARQVGAALGVALFGGLLAGHIRA